jgi:MarR family protein
LCPAAELSLTRKQAMCFQKSSCASLRSVPDWGFLTNHARVLLCIAHDPGARLRDIAASLGITERSAHGIITDLAEAGYVVKQKDGRRNRYHIEAHLPLPEPGTREPAVGEVLAVLLGNTDGLAGLTGLAAADRIGGGPADGTDVITARAAGHNVPGGLKDDGERGADRPEGDLLPGEHGRAGTAGGM